MTLHKLNSYLDIFILGLAFVLGLTGNTGEAISAIALYMTTGAIAKLKATDVK